MKKSILIWAAIAGIVLLGIYYVHAGQLLFDGVPVDITTTANEDLVICPGTGGNTQIGDANGTNTNATSNDDLHVTGVLETDGAAYFDSTATVSGALTTSSGITSGSNIISDTDSTDNLGSSSIAWLNLYVDTIYAKGAGGFIAGEDVAAGSNNVAGVLKLFSAGDNAFYNTFTAGTNTANATYTLPVAMPGSDMVLQSTSAGVLSWIANAPGGDSVSIDGVAVTDPDFVSTGDIDFVNATNTVTADINEDKVQVTELDDGEDTPLADDVVVIDPADTTQFKYIALPDSDAAGKKLVYDTTNHAFSSVDETDPTVDTVAEILAIIDNTALDFGTGVLTATGFVGPLTGAVTGNASTASALKTGRTIGGVSFDGTDNIVPDTITVADTTEAASYVALWEAATGDLAPKSDAGITYNAATGMLTVTDLGVSGTLQAGSSNITLTTAAGLLKHEAGGLEADISSAVQGDILYFNGSNWARLAAGTSGYFLMTQGPSANPVWASAFSCGDSFTYEGQVYSTVLIGSQCWMKENLNVGTKLATGGTMPDTGDSTIEKWCYDNSDANCTTYGGLYHWDEAMSVGAGSQGICPDGWHIPSDTEWCTMTLCVDGTVDCNSETWSGTDCGTKLKEGGSSGFEGLLAGYRGTGSTFYGLTTVTHFWSSTGTDGTAWTRYLHVDYAAVTRDAHDKALGFSVRCLRD